MIWFQPGVLGQRDSRVGLRDGGAAKRIATTESTPAEIDHMTCDEEMARPERFELPTTWFEVTSSRIQQDPT